MAEARICSLTVLDGRDDKARAALVEERLTEWRTFVERLIDQLLTSVPANSFSAADVGDPADKLPESQAAMFRT